MAKISALAKIKKSLDERYIVEWEDDNIISVQIDPESPVVAFLVYDNTVSDKVIISVAQDFPDSFIIADIVINCYEVSPIVLGEGFYVSNDGHLLWGEAGYKAMQSEVSSVQLALDDFPDPKDKNYH